MPTSPSARGVRRITIVVAAGLLAALAAAPAAVSAAAATTRFATFNASLNRGAAGQALTDLSTPGNAQASAVAEIIQRTRPEILLINEFDYYAPTAEHPNGPLVDAFRDNYLEVAHHGAVPIDYPYSFVAPSNTGISSGFDLNNNGVTDTTPGDNAYGDDSLGFGVFPGQFGLVVYSQHPILTENVRTFQHFLWKDMPGARLPDDSTTPAPRDWYSAAELAIFPLSSKSHWDVPIDIDGTVVHFLVSHPTPPVFDGPEDRNGTRNADEIRLWADYISGGTSASYIYDDNGTFGGLASGALFVIAGDQNSDPNDGDSIPGAAQQLLDHPLVNDSVTPESLGAVEQALLQGGINLTHRTPARYDTADFAEPPGNLRVDYVLPHKSLRIVGSAVFWPTTDDPLFRLVGVFPFPTSDHKLVWVDLRQRRS